MKFLFFNAVVAVALVYLFTGGDWSVQTLKEIVSSEPKQSGPVQAPVKETQKTSPSSIPAPARPPVVASVIAPDVSQIVASVAPPVVSQASASASLPAIPLSRAIIKRRAEVLLSPSLSGERPPAPLATLSPAADRRRALLQIAEEMELFSVEAALQ